MPEGSNGKLSAKEKAEILSRVAERHGGELTAESVVRESDPQNESGVAHELAPLLEWRDFVAAHEHRVNQARRIIRSAEPELISLGVIQLKAPHYVRDPRKPPGKQGYAELLSLKTHEEHAADVMREELDRACSALERARGIAASLERDDDLAHVDAALRALRPLRSEEAA